MSIILNLETATTNCSVSLAKDGELLAIKEHDTPNYSHSEQLHVFIQEVLNRANFRVSDLDAVAVSKGPGSYTGLRIGVSSAKGLCFSLNVPLISISTLESMAFQVISSKSNKNESDVTESFLQTPNSHESAQKERYSGDSMPKRVGLGEADYVVPALDARRMEVYSAVFDSKKSQVRETKAEIIDESSFSEYVERGKVLLIGSGADKCKALLEHPGFSFDASIVPSAREMAPLSYKKFTIGDFEDVAYFEPYYLKDFILQKKK